MWWHLGRDFLIISVNSPNNLENGGINFMLNKKLKHQEVKYITEDSSTGFKSVRFKTVFSFQQVF